MKNKAKKKLFRKYCKVRNAYMKAQADYAHFIFDNKDTAKNSDLYFDGLTRGVAERLKDGYKMEEVQILMDKVSLEGWSMWYNIDEI